MLLPTSVIDEIFKWFNSMYGESFVNKWKHANISEVKAAWSEALGEFNHQTIKAALNECFRSQKYVPSCPEFYQICQSVRVYNSSLELPAKAQYREPSAAEIILRNEQMREIASLLRVKKLHPHVAAEIVDSYQTEVNRVRNSESYAESVIERAAIKNPEIDMNVLFGAMA